MCCWWLCALKLILFHAIAFIRLLYETWTSIRITFGALESLCVGFALKIGCSSSTEVDTKVYFGQSRSSTQYCMILWRSFGRCWVDEEIEVYGTQCSRAFVCWRIESFLRSIVLQKIPGICNQLRHLDTEFSRNWTWNSITTWTAMFFVRCCTKCNRVPRWSLLKHNFSKIYSLTCLECTKIA